MFLSSDFSSLAAPSRSAVVGSTACLKGPLASLRPGKPCTASKLDVDTVTCGLAG